MPNVDRAVVMKLLLARMESDATMVDLIDSMLKEARGLEQISTSQVSDWLLDLRRIVASNYDALHAVIGPGGLD